MDMRFLNFRLVGTRKTSPKEIAGNSSGGAGGEYTSLDCLDQFGHEAMAIIEAASGIADSHDGSVE
jgi:hypothetical protein